MRPVELAAVFHFKLASIHPLDDGNGRVARLLMNLILIKYGYPVAVLKRYDRRKYYGTLEKADNGNLKPFVNFVARCVEESLDLYLSVAEPAGGESQLLTMAEAAKVTPFSQEYLSLLARRGVIPATKIGKNWHVTSKALREYIERRKSRRRGL
jgi:excisionase family DNA binding protein